MGRTRVYAKIHFLPPDELPEIYAVIPYGTDDHMLIHSIKRIDWDPDGQGIIVTLAGTIHENSLQDLPSNVLECNPCW